MPLRDGLTFAHSALVGIGVRDQVKLGASGKIATAFDIARALALGADWCNTACSGSTGSHCGGAHSQFLSRS
jgi:glutamate synthase domain-containing protein 2